MSKLIELETRYNAAVERMKAIADADGEMTEGEQKEVSELSAKAKVDKASIDQLRSLEALTTRSVKKPDKADADFADRKKSFSIGKVIAHQLRVPNVDAGDELEVSQEIANKSNLPYEGNAVPAEALTTRAVGTGTTEGGRLLTDDFRGDLLVNELYAQLVAGRLGVTILRGLTQDIAIPKIASGVTPTFKAEKAALDEADPSFDNQIKMTPHKIGAISSWTKQMMIQAQGLASIETVVRQLLLNKLSEQIDNTFLNGTGASDQPSGFFVANTQASERDDSDNGKALSLADVWAMTTSLANTNAPATSRAFLINPNLRSKLAQTEMFATTGRTIYQDGAVLGMPAVMSTLVPNNRTKGSGTALSAIAYGNWSSAFLAMFGDVDVLVNEYRDADYKAGNVAVRVMAFMDVAFARSSDFVWHGDVITA